MKKGNNLFLVIFTFIGLFVFSTKVKANTINNIEMDVYIDEKGNAQITEIWDTYLTNGTESYRSYANLGNLNISNFTVTDETGTIYENLSYWDTRLSFEEKAYKNGINYISNGIELCWGITKYGEKTYKLKYNISNMVTQYIDNQGIYFNFINLEQDVENAKITIHSNYPFSLENSQIWAFGYNGTINFENGSIVLNSNGSLKASQDMVALVKFKPNLFNTHAISSQSFADVYDSAMEGVSDNSFNWQLLIEKLKVLSPLIILSLIIIVKCFQECLKSLKREKYLRLNFVENSNNRRNMSKNKEIQYQGFPLNKDFYKIIWTEYKYYIVPIYKLIECTIEAILSKWIDNGDIKIVQNQKDNTYNIDFRNFKSDINEIEKKLLKMFLKASRKKVLKEKKLKNFFYKKHKKIYEWFYNVIFYAQDKLEKEGLIINEKKEKIGMFYKKKITTVKKVSPKLTEEANNLVGLRNFLLDKNNYKNGNINEINFKKYSLYLQVLGIERKVLPLIEKNDFSLKNDLFFQNNCQFSPREIARDTRWAMEKGRKRKSFFGKFGTNTDTDFSTNISSGGSSYSGGGSSAGGSSGGGFR